MKDPELIYIAPTAEFPSSTLPVVLYCDALHLPPVLQARYVKHPNEPEVRCPKDRQ